MLMKFSVAPESSRVTALALFDFDCIKTCSIIDFRFDINTSWSRYHLISADLIRHLENPATLLHISVWIHPSSGLGVDQTRWGHCRVYCLGWWLFVGLSFPPVHRGWSWSWLSSGPGIGPIGDQPCYSCNTCMGVDRLVWLVLCFLRMVWYTKLGHELDCSCPLVLGYCLSSVGHLTTSLVVAQSFTVVGFLVASRLGWLGKSWSQVHLVLLSWPTALIWRLQWASSSSLCRWLVLVVWRLYQVSSYSYWTLWGRDWWFLGTLYCSLLGPSGLQIWLCIHWCLGIRTSAFQVGPWLTALW